MRRQMVYILRMPAYPHIERYHAEKQRYIDFGGSDNEQSIRRAFANCLDAYCRDHKEKLALIDELGASLGNRPDGGQGLPPHGPRLLGGQGHPR